MLYRWYKATGIFSIDASIRVLQQVRFLSFFLFTEKSNPRRETTVNKMLKFVALLVLCYVIIDVEAGKLEELPPEVQQMVKNLHSTCVSESGVVESEISDANNGKFSGNESLKCYMKCLMVSIGVLDDDGVFDGEAYIDLLPPNMQDHGKKTVENCKATGGNACEIAYNLNLCNYNIDPSKYMLF